jgi:hypothetical protein
MVASIVGAWALIAYVFYRLSRMSEDIRELVMSKVNVKSNELQIVSIDKRLTKHSEILSDRAKDIGILEDTQAALHRKISDETTKRQAMIGEMLEMSASMIALKSYIDEHINGRHKDLCDDLRTLDTCFKESLDDIKEKLLND